MIDIVIPIYKERADTDDCIALKQAFNVLKNHPITFVHPKSLDITAYKSFGDANFKAFDDRFFKDIRGYNSLMLSVDFYKAFNKTYILIYQTDAFIFKDDLALWCNKNYDYVGAPWIRSSERMPLPKRIWDNLTYCGLRVVNYHGNRRTQKNKALLYNEVGNGGFSLRKREKMIAVLEQLPLQVQAYLNPKNNNPFFAEDVFFSVEPQRNGLKLSKPNYKEACRFAIENKPELALSLNGGELPMGCHRWNKESRPFWSRFIDYGT